MGVEPEVVRKRRRTDDRGYAQARTELEIEEDRAEEEGEEAAKATIGRYWRVHGRPGWLMNTTAFSWDRPLPLHRPRMGTDTNSVSTGGGELETERTLESYLIDEIEYQEDQDKYETTREHIPHLSDDSDSNGAEDLEEIFFLSLIHI